MSLFEKQVCDHSNTIFYISCGWRDEWVLQSRGSRKPTCPQPASRQDDDPLPCCEMRDDDYVWKESLKEIFTDLFGFTKNKMFSLKKCSSKCFISLAPLWHLRVQILWCIFISHVKKTSSPDSLAYNSQTEVLKCLQKWRHFPFLQHQN